MRLKESSCTIYIYWLIAFFVVSPSWFWAQTQRYAFHSLSPEEGLSQASNNYIYHDSKGFIWLSSLEGLNRFDGQNVKTYKFVAGDSTSLLDNIVTSNFFEDQETNIWFTTYEGIHCYLREKDHFLRFQVVGETGEKRSQDYHAFYLDKAEKLWVRVGLNENGKLFLFDTKNGKSNIVAPLKGQRNYPILNEQGHVDAIISSIFSKEKKGIEIFPLISPQSVQSYFDGKQKHLPALYVHQCMSVDEVLYLATDQGLFQFDSQGQDLIRHDTFQGKNIGRVFGIAKDVDHTLWITTTRQRILQFDSKTGKFIKQIPYEPQSKMGLKLNPTNKIHIDHHRNLWVTSFSSGIQFTNLNKPKFQRPDPFVGKSVFAFFETQDGQIFTSYGYQEVARFDPKEEVYEAIQLKDSDQNIQFYFEDNEDQLYGITSNYLLKWEGHAFEFLDTLPATALYFFDNKSNLKLLSTYAGLYQWTGENFILFDAIVQPESFQATAIFQDQEQRLYLALDASKLKIYENQNGQFRTIRQIDGIGFANAFHEAKDTLWVATSTGLVKINKNDLSAQLPNEKSNGLPSEYFYSIVPDSSGSFWLSCNRGIIQYWPESQKFWRFKLADGLQSNEFNTNAFLKTRNGEIWLGGTKGLNRIKPNAIQKIQQKPNIQLTGLQVNDSPYQDPKQQIGELRSISLPYQQNTISFSFAALEYSDPKNNQFQYQLVNHESNWVDAGNRGFARYSNLPHGYYTFKVKAANSDGIFEDIPYELKVHIQTPWYKSIWFYIAIVLAITAIIYGVFRYRLEQALKIERMRVKISSDLHDDVGSLLAGLAMKSEILEVTATEARKPQLQRIGELSRSAMSRMRDTVWAIDARKDKLENLLDRIREHAMETLELKGMAFDLQVENLALTKTLTSQVRQNLYLICKEAITNATKHSNGDHMHIQFSKYGRNGLALTIHDNGKVAAKNYKTTGLGMSNMTMRAEQINAKLEVDPSDGFTIRLWM